MTPAQMPRRLGVVAPRQRPHPEDCRCLDCIDMDGKPTRRSGITADRQYRAARKAVGL